MNGEKKRYYHKAYRSEIIKGILESVSDKRPLIAGIIVLTPITVVGYLVYWFFGKIREMPGDPLFSVTGIEPVDQLVKLGVFLVATAFLVTGIGRFARTNIGLKAENRFDRVMGMIPVLGTIYKITKVTADTVFTGTEELSKPVKLDINGLRLTAFKTGNGSPDGRKTLFLPTSPNITTGFVIEAEPERFDEIDETSEEALTRVLSAGFGSGHPSEKGREEPEDRENI